MAKFLLCGLGNPGAEYQHTRHNIGFDVLDALAQKLGLEFAPAKHGLVAEGKFKGRPLVLLKPNTFMNLSGKALRYWQQQHKLSPNQLLVITDDLALPPMHLRLKTKGGSGGHNGLSHIEESLQSQAYARLRFGIGKDFPPGGQSDYVLGPWAASEKALLPKAIETAAKACLDFCFMGPERTMNWVNGWKPETSEESSSDSGGS